MMMILEIRSWRTPPFCSNIPIVDLGVDDDEESNAGNKRKDGEGIWLKK